MALKSYNPVTPSQRQLVLVDRSSLYRGAPVKTLTEGKHAAGERIEYDPNRTAFIALIKYPDGEVAYILAPQRLSVGDTIVAGEYVDVKPGNAMPVGNIP